MGIYKTKAFARTVTVYEVQHSFKSSSVTLRLGWSQVSLGVFQKQWVSESRAEEQTAIVTTSHLHNEKVAIWLGESRIVFRKYPKKYLRLTHDVRTLAAALWKLKLLTARMLSRSRVSTYLLHRNNKSITTINSIITSCVVTYSSPPFKEITILS